MDADEKRQRVLYVSDRDTDSFRAALDSDDDLLLLAAGSISEGRDRLSAEIDCVVCQHRDGFDGIGFLEAVRSEWPHLPFVLVAHGTVSEIARRAVAADVTEFVSRSTPVGIFEERLAAALARPSVERSDPMRVQGLSDGSELRLKERAMDEAPVGITISDPDSEDNPVVYVNDRFEQLTGYSAEEMRGTNCRILQGAGTDPETVAELREAIDAERPVSVELLNYRKDGTPFWNEVTVAPLRDEGELTNYVGFQSDVTERKEAEFALETERAALEHLLDRLDGLLQDVTKDLVEATDREAIEAAVCERFADLDAYPFAWIGRHDLVRDAIVPVVTAGAASVPDDSLTVDLDVRADSPIARAYESGVTRILTDETGLEFLPRGNVSGVEGLVAIPLSYGETSYGILVLWTSDVDALTDHEIAVFEALARMTATAINALERGRIIGTDDVVELEIAVSDPELFFVTLSKRAGCRLEYLGAIERDEDAMGLFFATDATPEVIEANAANLPGVASTTLLSEGGEDRYEFVIDEPSIVTLLARRGVKIRDITASGGRASLRIELPVEANAREVFELVEARYPDSELVGRRERERPPRTERGIVSELDDRLTDRQLAALRIAYISGFYRPSRRVTGDELAATMDISRSTYHQHLRAAERKLIGAFFELPSALSWPGLPD